MTSGERRIRGSVHEKTRGKGMHFPANCPAAVPERESGFFRNPLPGSPPEKFAPSRTVSYTHLTLPTKLEV